MTRWFWPDNKKTTYTVIEKMKKLFYFLCFVLSAVCFPLSGADKGTQLAADGKGMGIYIFSPTAVDRYAARELAHFLKMATGVEFKVHENTVPPERRAILLGTGIMEKTGTKIPSKLGDDGIYYRIDGDTERIFITGGIEAKRGTLNAVYSFLEDCLDIRFFTPEFTGVEKKADRVLLSAEKRFVPPFRLQRCLLFQGVGINPDWCARARVFGAYMNLRDEQGGQQKYVPGFHHTFEVIAPSAKHFKEHPDWYSMVNGKRLASHNQWCLTSEGLFQFVLSQCREILRKAPPDTVLCVSQNDWRNNCQCPECRKIDDYEGSPAGTLVRFLNRLAKELRGEFPNVKIETLSYLYSTQAPKFTSPEPEVIIRLALINRNYSYPIEDEANKRASDSVRGWSRLTPNLTVWDYAVNFRHLPAVFPNLRNMCRDIKFFADNGVRGLFVEGNHKGIGGDFKELKLYVLSRLAWDPSRDIDKEIREFCDAYYGEKAAMYLMRYFDELDANTVSEAEEGHAITTCEGSDFSFLSNKFLRQAEKLFDQAIEASDNEEERERIRFAKLSIQYVILLRSPMLQMELAALNRPWPFAQSKDEMLEEFVRLYKKGDLSIERAGQRKRELDKFYAMASVNMTDRKVPSFCDGLAGTDWIESQDGLFDVWNQGRWATFAKDELASDGSAVWMPGTHRNWAVNLSCPEWVINPENNEGEWDVFVALRADLKNGASGAVFSSGIHGEKGRLRVNARDLSKDEYRFFKVGTVKNLSAKKRIWAAPENNPGLEKIWIDRYIFVRKAAVDQKNEMK